MLSKDSYGYRPNKSALDAVATTRKRCWKYDWVVDMDIQGFYDNLDHELLMRAVRKHTDCKWLLLYIDRWLKAPMESVDGQLHERMIGSPQGGKCKALHFDPYAKKYNYGLFGHHFVVARWH